MDLEINRVCRLCKQEKNAVEYGEYVSTSGKTLRRKVCNTCRREVEATRYRNDPNVKIRMTRRARVHRLKTQYGLSENEVELMKAVQQGNCAICHLQKVLCVDHKHATNQVRGLLCRACNFGIGYFHDDIEKLRSAILYLEKYS